MSTIRTSDLNAPMALVRALGIDPMTTDRVVLEIDREGVRLHVTTMGISGLDEVTKTVRSATLIWDDEIGRD